MEKVFSSKTKVVSNTMEIIRMIKNVDLERSNTVMIWFMLVIFRIISDMAMANYYKNNKLHIKDIG